MCFCGTLPADICAGRNQRVTGKLAEIFGKRVSGQADCQRFVLSAQPARAGRLCWHQIGNRLCAIGTQSVLLKRSDRFDVSRNLLIVRCDQDQPLALWTLLELENFAHGGTIGWIAAKSVARFRRISNDATLFEMSNKFSGGVSQGKLFKKWGWLKRARILYLSVRHVCLQAQMVSETGIFTGMPPGKSAGLGLRSHQGNTFNLCENGGSHAQV